MVYGDFVGWALYYTDARVIGFGEIYGVAESYLKLYGKLRTRITYTCSGGTI